MKVLVMGANGQLGHDVIKECLNRGYEVIGTSRDKDKWEYLDITNAEMVSACLDKFKPDAVIDCVAYTNVDKAEDCKWDAIKVNIVGTKNVALACRMVDAKLIYLSSDYVFDGKGYEPWQVDDVKSPLNHYGKTKDLSEDIIKSIMDKYYIVRTSWVFGSNGKNFFKTMLNVGKKNDVVRVVNDQIGRPTYTVDLARLLGDMVMSDAYGVYHASNEGEYVSWYDLTCKLYEYSNMKTKVLPVSTEEYGLNKAVRPFNSRLDTSSLSLNGFSKLPDWNESLKRFLGELNQSQIKVKECPIKGLYEIDVNVHGDDRGYFMETYNKHDMEVNGLTMNFVQDNQSSSKKGVLRGLHFQKNYPQGKLVRVIKGEVFDVAVDLRRDSETFGQWYGVTLSASNKKQFYIPEGFAHGFVVLSDEAEFAYKCTDFYHPNDECGLAFNDPDINISWPIKGEYQGDCKALGYTLEDGTPLCMSDKDQNWLTLKKTFKF